MQLYLLGYTSKISQSLKLVIEIQIYLNITVILGQNKGPVRVLSKLKYKIISILSR